MLKRPKSAVLLSLPYNFQSKQQAVDIKQKVKQSLLTFQTQQSLDIDLHNQNRKISCRSYIDNGPSLLNTSANHYSLVQNHKTFRSFQQIKSLQQSRATSAQFTKRKNIQNHSLTTGLQNYQRLKPCKSINQKSLQHLQNCLNNARKQSKFIDRIFQNISPQKQLVKKPKYAVFKKRNQKQKQNSLQIKGLNFNLFQEPTVEAKIFDETPYKTNVFQPTLQRKGLQLLRKSKAYLMARG